VGALADTGDNRGVLALAQLADQPDTGQDGDDQDRQQGEDHEEGPDPQAAVIPPISPPSIMTLPSSDLRRYSGGNP
jgi:uncharacterized protein (DUF2345 family)